MSIYFFCKTCNSLVITQSAKLGVVNKIILKSVNSSTIEKTSVILSKQISGHYLIES
jgi:hypothetical protein